MPGQLRREDLYTIKGELLLAQITPTSCGHSDLKCHQMPLLNSINLSSCLKVVKFSFLSWEPVKAVGRSSQRMAMNSVFIQL